MRKEWKNIFHNAWIIVVIVAIILIPSIYSCVFLGSMWDPYGNSGELPVAVVNEDKEVTYNDEKLNVGEELVKNLKENDSLDFHFLDATEAKKGLENGDYYMVITIPENFSKNATTLLDDEPQKMVLNYTTNPGTNYIAEKMDDSAMSKIKQEVSSSVTKTYAETIFDQIEVLSDGLGEAGDGTTQLSDGVNQLVDGNQTISDNLKVLASSSLTFKDGANTLTNGLKDYTDGVVEVNNGVYTLKNGVKTLNDATPTLSNGVNQLNDGANALQAGINQYTAGVSAVNQGTSQLVGNNQALNNGASQVQNGVNQLTSNNNALVSGAKTLQAGVSQLAASSDTLVNGAKALQTGVSQLATSSDTLVNGANALQSGVNQLNTNSDTLNKGTQSLQAGVNQLVANNENLTTGSQTLSSGLNQLYNAIAGEDGLANGIRTLNAGLQPLTQSLPDAIEGSKNYNATKQLLDEQYQAALDNTNNNLENLPEETLVKLLKGYKQLSDGGSQITGPLAQIDTDQINALSTGLDRLDSSVNDEKKGLKTSVAALAKGASDLNSGITQYTTGVSQLQLGLNGDGTAKNPGLVNGIAAYTNGVASVKAGLDGDGTAKNPGLVNGIAAYTNGVASVKAGLDGDGTAKNPGLVNGIATYTNGVASVKAGLDGDKGLVNGITTYTNGVATIKAGLDGEKGLINGIAQYTSGVQQVADGAKQLDNNSKDLNGGATALSTGTNQLASQVPTLVKGVNALNDGAKQLYAGTSTLVSNNETLVNGANALGSGAGQISDGASQLADGSQTLGSGLTTVKDGITTLDEALKDGAKESQIDTTDKTFDMMSAPVDVTNDKLSTVENNGHAMAPYMMSVALYVCALAFTLMYPVREGIKEAKTGWKYWLSKASVMYSVSTIAAIVMITCLRFINGFEPQQLLNTYLFAILVGAAFMSIVLLLNVTTGYIGEFLLLVFMIINLGGSAGTYPLETAGGFYKAIHNFVPYTYSVDGFRKVISMATASISTEVWVLVAILVVCSVLTIVYYTFKNKEDKHLIPQAFEKHE